MNTLSFQAAQPGAFTIDDFAKTYRIGRSTVYELLDTGELASFHVGRRRLISFEAAETWRRAREAVQRTLKSKSA